MHSRPSSAQAVAAATPCWPAPVSAITRGLPIRRASSAWPSALLILCEPVWVRSSRLSHTSPPASLGQARARGRAASAGRRSRAAAASSSSREGRVGAGREPLALELVERRDQRLRHVAAAVGAEAPLDRGRAHAGAPSRASRRSTARTKARQLGRVLAARLGLGAARDVDRERPRRPRSPAPTLSGVSPPDSTTGGVRRVQPGELPVEASPPCRPGVRGGVGVEQVEVGAEALQVVHLGGVAHARGLHHLGAGAPGGLAAVGRPLVAVQLEHASGGSGRPCRPPRRAWRSRTRRPARAAGAARRRSARPSSSAQARGLLGPEDHARAPRRPSSATRRASAGSLTPQILTRVTPAMVAGASGGYGTAGLHGRPLVASGAAASSSSDCSGPLAQLHASRCACRRRGSTRSRPCRPAACRRSPRPRRRGSLTRLPSTATIRSPPPDARRRPRCRRRAGRPCRPGRRSRRLGTSAPSLDRQVEVARRARRSRAPSRRRGRRA